MTQTIFDAMPIEVLQQLERIEVEYTNNERRAFMLQANAQDLRQQHDEIVSTWKLRAEREGLGSLIAERQRLDLIAWITDPLPTRTASEY